ncbi:MAG: YdbL family protein [Thermodesulfovibrionales bacterium]
MKKYARFLLVGLMSVIASCAVITVNIYFPEKDVKEAYKELEKELMAPGTQPEKKPEAQPETKPQSSIRFEFVPAAHAQEAGLSGQIRDIVRKMPDVTAAYKEIGALIPEVDKIRDRGAVGEGNNGLLVEREGPLSPEEKQLVEKMNANRKIVMRGMAKAIVRINRLPENEQNINQVFPQATAQFAAVRQDSAKKGWWVQDANGIWAKK